MRPALIGTVALCVVCGACQKPASRLNAPPHGVTENANELRDMYDQMTDNALLADMSMSDVHFLPDRAALNTLGQERLHRLVELMKMYGGAIRFNTAATDEVLVQGRTKAIVAYLATTGIDSTAELLVRDLPGGRGLDAGEAILIKANEATYKPKKQDAGANTFTLSPTGQDTKK